MGHFIPAAQLPATYGSYQQLFTGDSTQSSPGGEISQQYQPSSGLLWRYESLQGSKARLKGVYTDITARWMPVIDRIEVRIAEIVKVLVAVHPYTGDFEDSKLSAEKERLLRRKKRVFRRYFKPVETQLTDIEVALIATEGELRNLRVTRAPMI